MIEEVGVLAPAAGTLIVLACDASSGLSGLDRVSVNDLHASVRAAVDAWPEAWARGDRRDLARIDVAGAQAAVFALRGWNRMAGVLRMDDSVVLADPHGEFWCEGGSGPEEARGAELHEAFRCAMATLPTTSGEAIGVLDIPSGELLLADAWQPRDANARVIVAVKPGRYEMRRHRVACPWDEAVDARAGIQVVSMEALAASH